MWRAGRLWAIYSPATIFFCSERALYFSAFGASCQRRSRRQRHGAFIDALSSGSRRALRGKTRRRFIATCAFLFAERIIVHEWDVTDGDARASNDSAKNARDTNGSHTHGDSQNRFNEHGRATLGKKKIKKNQNFFCRHVCGRSGDVANHCATYGMVHTSGPGNERASLTRAGVINIIADSRCRADIMRECGHRHIP